MRQKPTHTCTTPMALYHFASQANLPWVAKYNDSTMPCMAMLDLRMHICHLPTLHQIFTTFTTCGLLHGNIWPCPNLALLLMIFPLSIVQCEPVLIYYDNPTTDHSFVFLYTPDRDLFLTLAFPPGVGYLDWICNIPAGYAFTAYSLVYQNFTVQLGSSSACLGDITTTYAFASYEPTYPPPSSFPQIHFPQ